MPGSKVARFALFIILVGAAPSVVRAAEAFAVLPLSEPPGPDAALVDLTGEVRAAIEARGAGVLGTEALRERTAGGAPAAALAAADAAYQGALDTHARGDFDGSIRALRAAIAELELLPGGAEVHARWRRAMLRLARSEQAVGRRGESQAVLQRLLRVEPSLEIDPRLYPPGFQRLVEEVRVELRGLGTRRLTVESQPGVQVWLEGREVGPAPATIELPPGRYRVAGTLGGIRSRAVAVDLSFEDRRVELDLSAAVWVKLDRGPGLAVARGERVAHTLAAARLLDLDRLVVVRVETDGGRPYLAAALVETRRGRSGDEGRLGLSEGRLPAGGAAALAAFLLAGEPSPLVEVAPRVNLAPVLPALAAPSPPRGLLGWDGVERPRARAVGRTAFGLGLSSIALGLFAVDRAGAANEAYAKARGMRSEDGLGVSFGHTAAEYNATIRKGDQARRFATGAAIGAGATLLGGIVLGIVSYRQTGEIGPIRF